MFPLCRSLALLVLALVLPGFAPGFSQEGPEVTPRLEETISKGVKWLLRAQNRDGSWGLDLQAQGDVTCTALAGLALLAGGATERGGEGGAQALALQKAVAYLLRAAERNKPDISAGQTTLIQGKLGTTVHNFFAVVFLTQIQGMRVFPSEEERAGLRATIERLAQYIARMQEPDGSWHKDTFGSLKATCMAWLALRAAASTGVPIRQAAVEKTLKFIKEQYNPSSKLYDGGGRMQGYQALYATASSVRVLYGMGLGQRPETAEAVGAFLEQVVKGQWSQMFLSVEGEDFLAAAMFSHALVTENGRLWGQWYPFIARRLSERQNQDGSWVTTACISGRTFATACALLALQTPKRLLPIQE